MHHAIDERLLALVRHELGLPDEPLAHDTRIDALGSSLDWVNLLCALEDSFGIVVDPADEAGVGTVADLMALVQRASASG